MGKLGIRSFSGPFDWYISSLQGVVRCLDSDFHDFLKEENLVETENPTTFKDINYEFTFNHDIKKSLSIDYDKIYEKYQRRINMFRSKITECTCFIRTISEDEIKYTKENEQWIKSIVKRENENNEIIYIVVNPTNNRCFLYPYFPVKYQWIPYFGRRSLRSLFDSNTDLKNFLVTHFDEENRKDNLLFDLIAENKRLEIVESRYVNMMQIKHIKKNELTLPKHIIIYGAGNLGKTLCEKLKGVCYIDCLVDKNPQMSEYDGIPVIKFDDYIKSSKYSGTLIIISPAYLFDEISSDLRSAKVENYVSVEKFYSK